jgi:hypothetical protein
MEGSGAEVGSRMTAADPKHGISAKKACIGEAS